MLGAPSAEEFRLALDLGQFTLLYQPVIRLEDLEVIGFEALVRWQHPRWGLLSPGDFVPAAEASGFIAPLGQWILEEACRQRSEWAGALGSRGEVTMAVNLSARQLVDGDVVALVESALNLSGVPPESLCLEVTETVLLDASTAPGTLEALVGMGVRIALDDFGTGYSSVGHLRRFPVHTIKIDRAFVADLDEPDGGPPLVAALAALAGTLGMDTVAEGVETAAQLRAVRKLGIQSAQGYLFARPLTAKEATKALEGSSPVNHALGALRSAGTDGADQGSGHPVGATGTMNARLADRFAAQRMIVDNYPTGALTVFDTDLRYVIVGGIGLATSSTGDMEGRLVSEVLPPALADLVEPHYRGALRGESATFDVPLAERTLELRVGPIHDAVTGEVIAGLVCTRDVTDERQSSAALGEAQELFRTAFENARIGMAVVGLDGRYQRVNHALCELTGYTAGQLCELTYMDLTHPDDRQANIGYTERLLTGPARGNEMEKRYVHALGHVVWVLRTASLVRDPSGEPLYYVTQIQDISERKEQEEALRWQAERDGLTRLWNRHRFDQEMARCHDRVEYHGEPCSVVLFDLNKFKAINDSLGHGAGDEVLKRVAAVLTAGVRSSDLAARYGGDEFAVIMPGTTRDVAGVLADRLLESIARERIFIDGRLVRISASAGVADMAGPDAMGAADRALYEAKRALDAISV